MAPSRYIEDGGLREKKTINKLVTAQETLGYSFNNLNLLQEALQAPGNLDNLDGNRKLGLVGATAMQTFIALEGYETGAYIVNINQDLDKCRRLDAILAACHRAGLVTFLTSNPSQGGEQGKKTKIGLVHALLGAVYCDSGIQEVGKAMRTLGILASRKGVKTGIEAAVGSADRQAEDRQAEREAQVKDKQVTQVTQVTQTTDNVQPSGAQKAVSGAVVIAPPSQAETEMRSTDGVEDGQESGSISGSITGTITGTHERVREGDEKAESREPKRIKTDPSPS